MGSSESTERSTSQTEQEQKDETMQTAAKVVGAAAGVATVAWGISKLFSEETTSEDRKKMKPPGKNGEDIYRDDFEKDPGSYFRRLRETTSEDRKKMKAPGKSGEYIYRDDFASDPASYFRSLRDK